MSTVRIMLVRHAQAKPHSNGKIPGNTYDGELSAEGYMQASQLAKEVDFSKFDIFCASNLIRALQTAIIATGYKKNIITSPDFSEFHFGDYEKRTFAELNIEQEFLQSIMQNPYHDETFTVGFPNGESHQDTVDRVIGCLRELIEAKEDVNNICLFTHGGVISILIKLLAERWPDKLKNIQRENIFYDRETGIFFM